MEQEAIINLSQKIVEELLLDNGLDTLGKWMANYAAEQIEKLKRTDDDNIKKECFKTILLLWKHLPYHPNRKRKAPFEDFEAIFNVLKKLDNKREFFYLPENDLDSNENPWIDVIKKLDESFKIFMRYAIRQAAISANSDEWVTLLAEISDSDIRRKVRVIYGLLDENEEQIESENDQKIKKIEQQIEILKDFRKLSNIIVKEYQKEIFELNDKESNAMRYKDDVEAN